MSEKENKYSYFVSYMHMPDGADIYMPGNMQIDLDREIRTGVDIRKVEEIVEDRLNGYLKSKGLQDTVGLLTITNFILLSGGESPALPTDDEIVAQVAEYQRQDFFDGERWPFGFIEGAKWMRKRAEGCE